jgi:hypothetical protein
LAFAEHPDGGAGDRQEAALPVWRVHLKGPQPSYPFAIPEAMRGPKDAERGTRLLGLCDREAELVKEGTHHAQPTAPMQPISIGEYDSPQRDGLQCETIKKQQVRMGDHRGLCLLLILGPDEAWALFQQHAMVRATTQPS